MDKRTILVLKVLCWATVIAFAALVIIYNFWVRGILGPDREPVWCGNLIIDPLENLLGIGTPLSVFAVFFVGVFWRRGEAAGWSVIGAAAVTIFATLWLMVFGAGLVRDALDLTLGDIVWWLSPFARWFPA